MLCFLYLNFIFTPNKDHSHYKTIFRFIQIFCLFNVIVRSTRILVGCINVKHNNVTMLNVLPQRLVSTHSNSKRSFMHFSKLISMEILLFISVKPLASLWIWLRIFLEQALTVNWKYWWSWSVDPVWYTLFEKRKIHAAILNSDKLQINIIFFYVSVRGGKRSVRHKKDTVNRSFARQLLPDSFMLISFFMQIDLI